jgi:hypothetical protein
MQCIQWHIVSHFGIADSSTFTKLFTLTLTSLVTEYAPVSSREVFNHSVPFDYYFIEIFFGNIKCQELYIAMQ